MNAGRARSAALVAALLILVAIALPPVRSYVRSAAYRLGVLHVPRPLGAGERFAGIPLQALDGSSVSIRPRPGHPLLINVFATWCSPCRDETPLIASVAPALSRAGIDVVGVDQAEPSWRVAEFAQSFGLHYPLYIDGNRATTTTLDARVIPTTVLVDRNDVVRVIHVGPLDSAELLGMTKAAGAHL